MGGKGASRKVSHDQFLVSKALCVCEDHCLRESGKRRVGIRMQKVLPIHAGLFENLRHSFQYRLRHSLIKLTKLIGQVVRLNNKPVTS